MSLEISTHHKMKAGTSFHLQLYKMWKYNVHVEYENIYTLVFQSI